MSKMKTCQGKYETCLCFVVQNAIKLDHLFVDAIGLEDWCMTPVSYCAGEVSTGKVCSCDFLVVRDLLFGL